jgi:PAS domain S-box-containing protein
MRQDALNRQDAAAQGAAEVVAAPADLIRVFEETQAMIRGTDGRILYWSRGSERLYGWSRESALGAISHELLKSKFPAPLSEIEAALGRNGLWSGELRHRHKDGSEVVVGSHWVLSRDENGAEIVIEVNNDISAKVIESKRMIAVQQQAIRELSTPALPFREGLLFMPIIGAIDGERAKQLSDHLLAAIHANRAKAAVIDIAGVGVVDSSVVKYLISAIGAARLMGTAVILTGLAPKVAQALVTLGVDFGGIRTAGDLQRGIESAETMLGSRDPLDPASRQRHGRRLANC